MKYENNFTIHDTTQLIDINKGVQNFRANISITTVNDDDQFSIVIVTQKDLDNVDFELNYKTITNYVSVDVESNENSNDDYVLIIKSDRKTNVSISIDLIDLDEQLPPQPQQPQTPYIPQQPQQPQQPQTPYIPPNIPQYPPQQETNYMLYLGLTILACLLIYYLFFYKSKTKPNSTTPELTSNFQPLNTLENVNTPAPPQPPQPPTVQPPTVQPPPTAPPVSEGENSDLLKKLRELRN